MSSQCGQYLTYGCFRRRSAAARTFASAAGLSSLPFKELETFRLISVRFLDVENPRAHLEEQNRPEPYDSSCCSLQYSQTVMLISIQSNRTLYQKELNRRCMRDSNPPVSCVTGRCPHLADPCTKKSKVNLMITSAKELTRGLLEKVVARTGVEPAPSRLKTW